MAEAENLVTFDEPAVVVSEGEQALLNFSQRAQNNNVVQASLGEELPVRNPENMEKREVPSPAFPAPAAARTARRQAWKKGLKGPRQQRHWESVQLLKLARKICSMKDSILEGLQSFQVAQRQMEEMLLEFMHRQQLLRQHIDHLLARLDAEEDHLELRMDRLNANMFAILDAMGPSASKLLSKSLDHVPLN